MAAAAQAGREVDFGIFNSPGELKAAADSLDAQITNTDAAIDGNEAIPQALWDGFQAFRSRWKAYYHENFDSPTWSWLTSDHNIADRLTAFIGDARSYALQLQRYGTEIPGPILQPEKPFSLEDITKPLTGIGITIDIAIALIVIGLIVWKGLK